MSLKSTRKRLKEYVELLKYGADEIVHTSVLAKLGKNPGSKVDMLKLSKKINSEKSNSEFSLSNLTSAKDKIINEKVAENNRLINISTNDNRNFIESEEIKRAKKEAYQIHINQNAKNIKDKIIFSDVKDNINANEKEYIFKNKLERKEINKSKIGLIITMVLVELITLSVVITLGLFIRFNSLKQTVEFDKSQVRNTNISETHLKAMEGFRTIAIFGLDSRTGSVGKGNNADVNIIVNINLGTGEVKLVSIYRDLYLSISDNNNYGKLNAAYSNGGPERAVKTLNKNFDLDIINYASFNWKAVATIIDLLGGIDLEVQKKEYKYMNAFIHETCIATGTDSKNPAIHYIKTSGMQHLDGIQAVAYARLRLMDSDFQRVERQKRVIELCLQKAKGLSIDNLIGIASEAAQMISFDVDWGELLSLIKNIDNINIVETASFPSLNRLETMDMGPSGNVIVPKTLEKSVVELHNFLYGEVDYEPSKAVKSYSNRILELRNKYAEENRINESIKQSESEEESKQIASGKKKKSTGSNVIRKTSDNSNNSNNNENGEVVPNIQEEIVDYEDEPEIDMNAPSRSDFNSQNNAPAGFRTGPGENDNSNTNGENNNTNGGSNYNTNGESNYNSGSDIENNNSDAYNTNNNTNAGYNTPIPGPITSGPSSVPTPILPNGNAISGTPKQENASSSPQNFAPGQYPGQTSPTPIQAQTAPINIGGPPMG